MENEKKDGKNRKEKATPKDRRRKRRPRDLERKYERNKYERNKVNIILLILGTFLITSFCYLISF